MQVTIFNHLGMCDASTAVAISSKKFVVANDEDNLLRIYRRDLSGGPIDIIDIEDYFENNPDNKETDIEGAAALEGRIYWIGSHGRNKKGKKRPTRQNFFANKIKTDGDEISHEQVGRSYTKLLKDLVRNKRLKRYKLKKASKRSAKEEGGLNIEGLAATPGKRLLIGFRNPIPDGKALIVPLKNPVDLIKGRRRAKFGKPIELDLGDLGIRSIEYWPKKEKYLIIAGRYDSDDAREIFQWSGKRKEKPQRIADVGGLSELNLEGLFFYPGEDDGFQMLSDDGSMCQDLSDDEEQFRSVWVDGLLD